MKVYDSRHKPLRLGDIVGQGGEASVYRVDGRTDLIAKVFEPAPRPNYQAKLTWMMANTPENPTRSLSHPSLAWPTELIYKSNRHLAGYLMPHIRQAVPVLEVFNPRRRAAVLPNFDTRYLYRAARNLSAAVAALHRSGYVIGDLNESNALVNPSALVTLIDTDSFQVQEQQNGRFIIHYCPVGKLEYTPPELMGRPLKEVTRLPEHDAFSLGVLIFQLLVGGNHPFRAQWLGSGEPPPLEDRVRLGLFPYMPSPPGPVRPPKNAPSLNHLSPDLARLFKVCFIDGHRDPSTRPSALEWRSALMEAEKDLLQCPLGHYYSGHLRACPACPPPRPRVRPAFRKPAAPAKPAPPQESPKTPLPSPGIRPPSTGVYQGPAASAPHRPGYNPSPIVLIHQLLKWSFSPGQFIPGARSATPSAARPVSRPSPSQPTSTTVAVQPPGALSSWLRPRLVKSFLWGGSIGALVGVVPGALFGLSGWTFTAIPTWVLLWVLGAVAAGAWRGWLPSSRLAEIVTRYIGWERLWRIGGSILGGVIGTLLGLIFWWAIFPIFLGLYGGAKIGARAGQKIWLAGSSYGWERIGVFTGALTTASLGGFLVYLVSSSIIGDYAYQPVMQLAGWLAAQEADQQLIGSVTGALGGAMGGALAGIFSDLVARLSGLLD
jgi:serine/threonine protein kinase